MIRYYNFEQRSPQWYTYREGRWTGSTAIDLLRGKPTPPVGDDSYDNKYMLRGRLLEPLAIEAYERKSGDKVIHFGFITNSKYPHAGYSPDGIVGDTIIEAKCLGVEKHMAIGNGEMPMPTEYIAQTHLGIVVSELKNIKFVLYNPDAEVELFVIDVEPDHKTITNIIDKLEATKPKDKPSATRAKKRYLEKHKLRVKKTQHAAYERTK